MDHTETDMTQPKHITKVNMFFYGLMRSGNHGIIFWVLKNMGISRSESIGHHVFYDAKKGGIYINDVTRNRQSQEPIINRLYDKNVYTIKLISVEEEYVDPQKLWISSEIIDDHDHKYDKIIFIIRDVLNCYCSRKKVKMNDENSLNTFIREWKKMYLQYTYTDDAIMIKYNDWLNDKKYRDKICNQLEISNTVDDVSYISGVGGGSSFRKLKRSDRNSYNKRYTLIDLSDKERSIFVNDKELAEIHFCEFGMDLKDILSNT